MKKAKDEWIAVFRNEADRVLAAASEQTDRKKMSNVINNAIKQFYVKIIDKVKKASQKEVWNNEALLDEILLITYASYIVMLEYRNKVWAYEYMAFARRIGELWEPFCKIPFEYPVKKLKLIEPPNFEEVQTDIKKKTLDYISTLGITDDKKRMLNY